jgi:hypothetical protein
MQTIADNRIIIYFLSLVNTLYVFRSKLFAISRLSGRLNGPATLSTLLRVLLLLLLLLQLLPITGCQHDKTRQLLTDCPLPRSALRFLLLIPAV